MFVKHLTFRPIKLPLLRGIKNASFLSAGNFISQAIGLVGMIFIARLFGPEKYGAYTTIIAFVVFFHLFILGGLSKVIVRESSRKIELFSGILEKTIGARIWLIGLAIVICITSSFFTNYSNTLKLLIIFYSTEIIYFGFDTYLSTIYQTTERMEYLAYLVVLNRILTTGLSILALYMGASVFILLCINLTCKIIVLVINFVFSRRLVKFRFNIKFKIATPFLKPVIVFSLIQFVNLLAIKIDILMISLMATSKDVGIYAVAHEIAREGLILRNIIATAFFPIAVKLFDSDVVKEKTVTRYAIKFFFTTLAVCIPISFFTKDIVIMIFGWNYSRSGEILRYLMFYIPFAFFSLPFTISLQATNNEKLVLTIFSCGAILNIPMNIVFFRIFGLIGIAYSTIIVFLSLAALTWLFTVNRLKINGYLV